MNVQAKPSKLIKGATGDWEVVIGLEVHAQVTSKAEAVLRRLDRVRRRAQLARLAGRCRDARHAAGDQRGMRAAGDAHRPRPQGQDQSEVGVRPEELFLSRPAAGLSDQPVQVADRGRGRGRGRHAGRRDRHGRHRAAASGAGRRQVAARPAPDHVLRRSQPLRRGADGDRVEARPALGRGGQGLSSRSCARSCAISAPATATWRRAACAPTSTCRCAGRARRSAPAARSRTSTRSASSARRSSYEARRQIEIIEDGGTIEQETRLFDPDKGETRSMRTKEEAHDYRYFPDPDLLPLEFDAGLCRRR